MSIEKKKSPPWEDALILALRDLQWCVKQQEAVDQLRYVWSLLGNSDKGKSELTKAFLEATRSVVAPPALLAKLDGAAESASGDVITSVLRRFFLFECKSSTGGFKAEDGKFVFELLKKIVPSTKSEEVLLSLSRRGHHVLYPKVSYDKDGVGSELALKGFLPVHKVTLLTRCYFDALVVDERPNQDPKWYTKDAIPAQELMWGNQNSIGLNVAEMAAYLATLSEVHQGGEHAHPMKVVIASPDGFFWPGGDLSDLLAMAEYFDNSLQSSKALYAEYQRHCDKLRDVIDQHQMQSVSLSEGLSP